MAEALRTAAILRSFVAALADGGADGSQSGAAALLQLNTVHVLGGLTVASGLFGDENDTLAVSAWLDSHGLGAHEAVEAERVAASQVVSLSRESVLASLEQKARVVTDDHPLKIGRHFKCWLMAVKKAH